MSNCYPELELKIHTSYQAKENINSIDFSTDGTLFTAARNEFIDIVDSLTGDIKSRVLCAETGAANINFKLSNNKLVFNSTKNFNTITLLDINTGKCEQNLKIPGNIECLTTIPDENVVICSTDEELIYGADIRAGQVIMQLNMRGPGLITSHASNQLLAEVVPCGVFVRDMKYFGRSYAAYMAPTEWNNLSSVKFSTNGNQIAICNGEIVSLFATEDMTPLRKISNISCFKNIPIDIEYSTNDNLLYSGTFEGHINIWDVETSHRMCTLKDENANSPLKVVKQNPAFTIVGSASGNKFSLWYSPEDEDELSI